MSTIASSPSQIMGGDVKGDFTPRPASPVMVQAVMPVQSTNVMGDLVQALGQAAGAIGGAIQQHREQTRIQQERDAYAKEKQQREAEAAQRALDTQAAQAERDAINGYNEQLAGVKRTAAETGDMMGVYDFLSGFEASEVQAIRTNVSEEFTRIASDGAQRAEALNRAAEKAARDANAAVLAHFNTTKTMVSAAGTAIGSTFTDPNHQNFQELAGLASQRDQAAYIRSTLMQYVLSQPDGDMIPRDQNGNIDDEVLTRRIDTETMEHFGKFLAKNSVVVADAAIDNRRQAVRGLVSTTTDAKSLMDAAFGANGPGLLNGADVKDSEIRDFINTVADSTTSADLITTPTQLHDAVMNLRELDVMIGQRFGEKYSDAMVAKFKALSSRTDELASTWIAASSSVVGTDKYAKIMLTPPNGRREFDRQAFQFWTDAGGTVGDAQNVRDLDPVGADGKPNAYLGSVLEGLLKTETKYEGLAEKTHWYADSKKTGRVIDPNALYSDAQRGIRPKLDALKQNTEYTTFSTLYDPATLEDMRRKNPVGYQNMESRVSTLATAMGMTPDSLRSILKSTKPEDFGRKVEIYRAAIREDVKTYGDDAIGALSNKAARAMLSTDPNEMVAGLAVVLGAGGPASSNFRSVVTQSGLSGRDRSTFIALAVSAKRAHSQNQYTPATLSRLNMIREAGLADSASPLPGASKDDQRLNTMANQLALDKSTLHKALSDALGYTVTNSNGFDGYISVMPVIAEGYMNTGQSASEAWQSTMHDMESSGYAFDYNKDTSTVRLIADPHGYWMDQTKASTAIRDLMDQVPAGPMREGWSTLFLNGGKASEFAKPTLWELYRLHNETIPPFEQTEFRVQWDPQSMQAPPKYTAGGDIAQFFNGGGMIMWRKKGDKDWNTMSPISDTMSAMPLTFNAKTNTEAGFRTWTDPAGNIVRSRTREKMTTLQRADRIFSPISDSSGQDFQMQDPGSFFN